MQALSKLKTFLLGQEILEQERRRAVRIPCKIKAAVEGLGTQATVVNISVLGLRLEMNSRLRKNVVVMLEGREYNGKSLTAKVIWCSGRGSDWQAGLMFVGSKEEKVASWVATALDRLGAANNRGKERRAHVRVPTEGIAYLANRSGDRLCEGELRNIGLGGALFLSEVELTVATPVRLQSDVSGRQRLDEEAQVRSCRRDTRTNRYLVGLQFSEIGSEPVRKYLKQLKR